MATSFHNKILRVDLTTGTVKVEEPGPVYLRRYMGGWNIIADVLLREVPVGADPLGPDNVLVFAPGLLTGLAGGAIGDRFGTRRTLAIGCLALGVTGALRGFSSDFATLASTVLLSGLVGTVVPMTLHKACGVWFSGRRLGLANGVVSAGMALGFMSGSMISATLLSPRLGDWRRVLFFYGGVAIVMSIPWTLTRDAPRAGGGCGSSWPAPSGRWTTARPPGTGDTARTCARRSGRPAR